VRERSHRVLLLSLKRRHLDPAFALQHSLERRVSYVHLEMLLSRKFRALLSIFIFIINVRSLRINRRCQFNQRLLLQASLVAAIERGGLALSKYLTVVSSIKLVIVDSQVGRVSHM
jgi:hypothetical protein